MTEKVTTEEFKKAVHDTLTWLANKVGETIVYDTWDDAFCRKELKDAYEKAKEYLGKYIDWDNLTNEQCDYLRFGWWSDESKLRLIPIWLYPLIPVGITLYDIGGGKTVFNGSNIDTDHRQGYLAFGIIPKE